MQRSCAKGVGIDHRVHGQPDTHWQFDADQPAMRWHRQRNITDDWTCDLNLGECRQGR